MKVILKEDVEHLGRLGDIKEVAPGYARNYLLPRGLVIEASKNNLAQVEHERRLIDRRLAERKVLSEALIARIAQVSLTIPVKIGADGKLFGSVTSRTLIAALAEQDIQVDRHAITLNGGPIKQIGTHTVTVDLGQGVTTPLSVTLVGDGDTPEPAPQAEAAEVVEEEAVVSETEDVPADDVDAENPVDAEA